MTQSHLIVTDEGLKIYKDDPASAILCEDQERARLLIWLEDNNGYNSYQYFKPKIGSIYPVPGIEFEEWYFMPALNRWVNPKKEIFNKSDCTKTVARLIEHTAEKESPEIDKESQDELWNDIDQNYILWRDQQMNLTQIKADFILIRRTN